MKIVFSVAVAIVFSFNCLEANELKLTDRGEYEGYRVWVIDDAERRVMVFYCRNGDFDSILFQEKFQYSVFIGRSRLLGPGVFISLSRGGKMEKMLQLDKKM